MELWRRIVDRVNAVGQHPKTQDDIRKRWNDLRGKETKRLQEEQYLGFREELKSINTTLGTIVGVLEELVDTRRDTVAQQGAPDTSLDDALPTTSTGASGQEALPQDHDASTPPPADGEPPCKRSMGSRAKTENNAKTPPRNETT
ncbi:hypothetical protein NDU88_007538 [Pleurodeles waltl]|uniref:Myb/SANT-like DNA-binding domain-containing protein n=1 Tax=Pleurodeles waltl TaxID=8319 RepID=A0AAV7U1F0_PLEWA|nr:hypothetical protein NDU88_007538 [Pleurodeles waltl]